MSNILLILSSPNGADSQSTRVALAVVDRLRTARPGATVTTRDLAAQPLPHIDADFITATRRQPPEPTPHQAAQRALSDALLAEVMVADVIVIGAAMLNFGVPSTLKSWVDHLAVPGKSFSYSAAGPEGLVKGKRVYVVQASSGIYSKGAMQAFDHVSTWLRQVLGFMGMTDLSVIPVEGTAFGPDAAKAAVQSAMDQAALAA